MPEIDLGTGIAGVWDFDSAMTQSSGALHVAHLLARGIVTPPSEPGSLEWAPGEGLGALEWIGSAVNTDEVSAAVESFALTFDQIQECGCTAEIDRAGHLRLFINFETDNEGPYEFVLNVNELSLSTFGIDS